MRRIFTAYGDPTPELDEDMQPDEQIAQMTRELMHKRPDMSFTAARREVLRDNPKLAMAYREQFD